MAQAVTPTVVTATDHHARSWEADDVTVGQVEAALSELRRHEQRAAVRTSVLTLVAWSRDDDAGPTAPRHRPRARAHATRRARSCSS